MCRVWFCRYSHSTLTCAGHVIHRVALLHAVGVSRVAQHRRHLLSVRLVDVVVDAVPGQLHL